MPCTCIYDISVGVPDKLLPTIPYFFRPFAINPTPISIRDSLPRYNASRIHSASSIGGLNIHDISRQTPIVLPCYRRYRSAPHFYIHLLTGKGPGRTRTHHGVRMNKMGLLHHNGISRSVGDVLSVFSSMTQTRPLLFLFRSLAPQV